MTDRFVPNPERRAKVAAISGFLTGMGDGTVLSWLEIEAGSSVKMDEAGKTLVREVLDRASRPYLTLHGHGLQLSSPENGNEIVGGEMRRVAGALRGAKETAEQVSARHLEAMKPDAKAKLVAANALLSSLDLSRSLARRA